MNTNCPAEGVLLQFLNEELSADREGKVDAHIEACSACQRVLELLDSDPPWRLDPIARLVGAALLIFVVLIVATQTSYVIKPGTRGVKVTLGKVDPQFLPAVFGAGVLGWE